MKGPYGMDSESPGSSGASQGRETLPSLTGLRWVAAFLVFGLHFTALQLGTPLGAPAPSAIDEGVLDVFGTGFIGVSFFFVLSGFVLTWSTPTDRPALLFWRHRFAKVFPVYVAASVLAVVLTFVSMDIWPSWRTTLAHAFLLQAWIPDQSYVFGLNPVMWSLSAEAFFYFCFPALLVVLVRASTRALYVTGAVCVALTLGGPTLVGRVFTLKSPEPTPVVPMEGYDSQFMLWFTEVFPMMRLTEFVVGIVVALLVRRGAWRGPNAHVALAICVVAFVLNRELPEPLQRAAGMLVPFALLIAAMANADREGRWTPFRGRTMVFLGKISFCFYAVHMVLILNTLGRIRPWLVDLGLLSRPDQALPAWGVLGCLVVYALVAGVAAWVLYRCVEVPMTRLIRGRSQTAKPEPSDRPDAEGPDEEGADAERRVGSSTA
ncbi:acyltransferase family protein [Streptomyces sp. NPDC020412]|uniref:acyltransferase family protein n=1 Tax=Streptomyces sp. NPDC020412 TaxID=3365073 RepID=UPI0037AD328F